MAVHLTGQQPVSLMNYLVKSDETDAAETLVRNLAQRVSQHEGELMTVAKQLEQRGLEIGSQEGFQESKI